MKRALLIAALALLAIPACAQAAFPGENGKIAYSRSGQIYTINPDGTGETNISSGANNEDYDPAWSPDGSKLIFTSDRNRDPECTSPDPDANPPPCTSDLYVINANGTGETRITPPNVYEYGSATWSPDGTQILYTRTSCPPGERFCFTGLLRANADGSGETGVQTGTAGLVRVHVIVEGGKVIAVSRSEGPTLLRQAAEDAARQWIFQSVSIEGRPTRLSGYIDFNFSL